MLARACLLVLALNAAPRQGPLSELVTHLELKHCDDAFELISSVEVPGTPDAENAHAARAIVRAAAHCKSDPIMALAFTGLAARLAPEDPTVLLEHATLLAAARQRAEASETLDRVIARHPDSFPRARLLRARVASEEADLELAVQLLTPLAADPSVKAEAEPLLAQCRTELQAKREAEGELSKLEAQAAERQQKREKAGKGKADPSLPRPLDQPSPDAGQLVAKLSGKVSIGGDHTFHVKGLRKGQNYTFKASGECSHKAQKSKGKKKKGGTVEDSNRSIFGVDFAVQFGQQETRALSEGQGEPELNEIGFTADADGMPIRVFDRSSVDKGVACTFTDFSVVVR